MIEVATISDLFWQLFKAKDEQEVDHIISNLPHIFRTGNWYPYGGNENNFGVIENQQSNPVAALVEKLTNSIDAILMRRCYEEKIDPKSARAPSSIEDGIELFFPEYKNWDLDQRRRTQAEEIQVLADSKRGNTRDTSLIIYDNGEGQHPDKFEETFLSLLRGNKNEIHFVQGKYNMGGSGAIVFCGKKRYQLLASKRYDGSGLFGFTLIRQHPLTESETKTKKNTWYEYLKIDGHIPSFDIDTLDLGLDRRSFRTGTIIKLYSYELKNNRHIRRDLQRSLNEFMYSPALPVLMVENAERYPNDNVLTSVVYGLQRRFDKNDFIESTFSEEYQDSLIGKTKVIIHVFKTRAKDKTAKETKEYIQNEYFKNGMAVLFSLNGQVHGHYTTEFITRSLQFPLLRDYLLIHIDCTQMNYEFRKELFMASRDRLKGGNESSQLREFLKNNLRKGRLSEIYKQRKDSISIEGANSGEDILRSFANKLPINGELRQLIGKTFKLDDKPKGKKIERPQHNTNTKKTKESVPFNPQRFPSFFNLRAKEKNGRRFISIPLNGDKTLCFDTDVEDNYFSRVEEAGSMQIAPLGCLREANSSESGNDSGKKTRIEDFFCVTKRSPQKGTIKLVLQPQKDLQVGDEIEIRADLSSPGNDLTQIFWVKISEPLPPNPENVPSKIEEELLGMPNMVQVFETDSNNSGVMTWEKLEGIDMDWDMIMYPLIEGEELTTIYINMSSSVLKDHISKQRKITEEQINLAHKRYLSAIYFHTLFLYAINRRRGFMFIQQDGNQEKDVELAQYLCDIFNNHYASFLLNFGTNELMDTLG